MKPPKITPGKWLNDSEVIYDEHGAIIAEIPDPVISARGRDADTVKAEMQEIRSANMDAIAALPECLAALLTALEALEKDAKAIGAAQCAKDIDWFLFGCATIAKQNNAMPAIRAALLKAGYTE